MRTTILALVSAVALFFLAGLRILALALRRQQEAQSALAAAALHDPLTGLSNRVVFNDRLEMMLHGARRQVAPGAVFLIDMNRFKPINDALGHAAGDTLLRAIGERLSTTVRAVDTVARLGGDEFAIVAPGMDAIGARSLGDRLNEAIAQPITLNQRQVTPTASIGFALFPDDATDPDALLRHADAVMYRIKRGHQTVGVVSAEPYGRRH
jgi:diguanylate cyclase (GGDEF)-like protein